MKPQALDRGTSTNPHDGVELAWESFGKPAGETVLLVHGSALSKAIWRGMGYVGALAEQYRVVTVDLRGHGRSDKPHAQSAYAMERFVEDIHALLDEVRAPEVHYVGYSLGARLGFALAVSTPGRLRSFTSLGGTYRISHGSLGELFFPEYDAVLADEGMDGFVREWEKHIGAPVDPLTAMAFKTNDPVALRAYFAGAEEMDGISESQLADVVTPTLLLAGGEDTRRLEASQRAAELMPNATFVQLPGRGHGDTLYPPEPVLAALTPFLAEH